MSKAEGRSPQVAATTTFTIFSDGAIPGWAEGFARLLREEPQATVEVAGNLEAALDAQTDVLVLNLGRGFSARLSGGQDAGLRNRRIIAMSEAVQWLRTQVGELELAAGMIGYDQPMIATDSGLLGSQILETPFRPFKERHETRLAEIKDSTPILHFGASRLIEFRPHVDYIVTLAELEDCAVVMRQASVVFAGVHAHPDEFSSEYRKLMRQVALALATRPIEPLAPIVVNRQVHPPGTSRFGLSPAGGNPDHVRTFYFRFDRPTAFTATLEHTGSKAMMLLFMGDAGTRLHWTRVDSEDGKTLTIATNIRQPAIDAIGHRYWEVEVANFDGENSATATLTVRYDQSDAGHPLLPLAGDDGFETLNWRANALFKAARTGETDAIERFKRLAPAVQPPQVDRATARTVVAREYGFNDWGTLSAHVAWETRGNVPSALAFGARLTFERGLARYPNSFSAPQLGELSGGFPTQTATMLEAAFARAKARGHEHFSAEHLLEALIAEPASNHALRSVGCDLEALRSELDTILGAIPTATFDGETQVSERACAATYRADFIPVLGGEGMNPGSLLAGLMGEDCDAQKLLAKQGIRQQDFVNYVSHGIPTRVAEPAAPGASLLSSQLEAVVQSAFAGAKASRHQFLTTEHLAAALLDDGDVATSVQSTGVDPEALARDLAEYVNTATPRRNDSNETKPTRAFNGVMQIALALARRAARDRPNALDAFQAIRRERHLPTCVFLRQHGAAASGQDIRAVDRS